MATDWDAEQLSAYADIEADGFSLTLRRPGSAGSFDPDTMAFIGATDPTDYQTYALRKDYKSSEVDGTIIQRGDSMLIVPAYGLPDVINTSDQIIIGSATSEVVFVNALSPGNVPILFNIQVRS